MCLACGIQLNGAQVKKDQPPPCGMKGQNDMITERFIGYPERPRNEPKISDMRRQIEAHRDHLIGETNPSKRAIIEYEMARLARKIVLQTCKSSIKRAYHGRF